MIQDVLERIRHAETQAETIKSDARKQADEILAKARQAAAALIEETKRKAREEGAAVIVAEESKAHQEAEEIRRRGTHKAAQLRKEAEARLSSAVEFVLKHLVMRP
jgi:vacuolar-type H+-ATPase subunit H